MIRCPYCKGRNLKKAGHLSSGKQRYYCKNCDKHFNENTIPNERPPITQKCKICGGKLIRSGFNRNGSQRYLCTVCGTKCTEGVIYKPYADHGITCPKCNCNHIKKSGFTKDGRQLYVCNKCKYKFTLTNKYVHTSDKNKKLIAFYGVHLKVPNRQLAEMIGCCEKTIRNIKRQYKINNQSST